MPGTGEVNLGGPDGQLNITNNLRVIPGDAGDVRLGVTYPFDSPVYWQLPKQFLGDRVSIKNIIQGLRIKSWQLFFPSHLNDNITK